MILLFISILISFAYLFLMMHFISGWKSIPEEFLSKKSSELFISVIVPFRNEEAALPHLLERIAQQSHSNFELILVNDHSTDNSLQAIEPFLSKFPKLKIIQSEGLGKKNALKEGIAQADAGLVVCTDADCLPNKDWLKSIAQYQEKEIVDFLICPVKMSFGKMFFSKLQALEFTSLVASGAGAAGSGM
jgi:poly-beta-1,6-N-acetyl-D-glucosamine synthase